MSQFENILVCLDRTEMDAHLIRYSAMMAKLAKSRRVIVMHVTQVNIDMSITREFRSLMAEEFNYDCKTDIKIIQGSNVSEVMAWEDIASIDLIIMGIKPGSKTNGQHAAQVLEGSLCSVLLVPNNDCESISRVLLPVDFSKNSARALEVLTGLQQGDNLEILLQHVFYVPTGYSSTGKTYEQFAEIMQKNREKDYAKFKRRFKIDDSNYEMIFTLDNDDKPSDNIYEMAEERNVNLIVLGSLAKTRLASMIIKSTSLGLLKYDEDIPCLVVKDKEDNIGFFDALMRI